MGKDSPQAKDSTKGKEQARAQDQTTGAEPTGGGIGDAARDAWSGFTRWGKKAVDKVGDTSTKVYNEAKDAVKSEKGQAVIKKTREGAAKAIETVGGQSDNQTVNEVTKNVKLIPGAGTVVNAAETLTKGGVTGIVRDGKGQVNKEALIRGAVETAPVSGDAARLKNLADRTGVTGTVVDKVQEQLKKSKAETPPPSESSTGQSKDKKPKAPSESSTTQPQERQRTKR